MKKRIKRLGAFLLAGICVFSMAFSAAGCRAEKTEDGNIGETKESGENNTGNDGGTSGAKGCYVESELTTPAGLKRLENLQRLSDHSLAVLDVENGVLHISKDEGESWEKRDLPGISELVKGENGGGDIEILANAVAEDGSVFYGFRNWGDAGGDYAPHYYFLDQDGNGGEVSLEENFSQAVFTADHTLYGIDGEGTVYRVDTASWSSQKLFAPENPSYLSVGSCGSRFVMIDSTKAYFCGKDDTEADSTDEVLNARIRQEIEQGASPVIAGDEDDKVYLASQSGIYSHVSGGSVMEQLADGALFTLGEPTRVPAAMLAEENGSFLIGYEDGLICSYIYDPDMPAVPEKQLNVYSLRDNASVRGAIASFRKKHPDVYVKLEIGMDGEDGVTASDAVKNLNTRLLADEGPDIILLDGMPIDSYMEKGMLADISEVLEEVQKDADYFTNLFSGYQKGDAVYAVPLRFQIPVLTGMAEEISGLSDLKSLADRIEQIQPSHEKAVRVLGSSTAEELLRELQYTCGTAWVKDGEVDTDALEEYFTQAKRIYEAEQKNLSEEDKNSHSRAMEMRGTTIQEMWNEVYNITFDVLAKRSCFGMGNLSDSEAYPKSLAVLKEMENGGLTVLPGQEQNVYIPSGITGIASGSKETELAKEFVKELLSTDVQSKDAGDGLPVNKDAFLSWTEKTNSDDYTMGMVEVGGGSDGEVYSVDYSSWPTDEQWQELLTIIEGRKKPCLTDEVVLDAVESVGESILTGEKTIEGGVSEIAQKINLYFKE